MRSWRSVRREDAFALPTLSPELLRALTLFVMAAAPAIGFFFNANPGAIVASGVTIAAAMALIALRPIWRSAAWAAAITGAAWAEVGFALHAEPISFSICLALAAAAGLTQAHLRRAAPGAALALAMAMAALALGTQGGMVGPAGISFGVIVAMAAAIGAMTLRLEAVHLAAFGAALIGLFVFSGQETAAIWFTPVVAWMGAWFFGLAVIRTPQLGAQGAAIAGTGALASIIAAGALHLSGHGLANDVAATGAFLVVAIALAGLLALSALRDGRGVEALKLTTWVLTLGAFTALANAIYIITPPPLTAACFAAVTLGLSALDARISNAAWRTFALIAAALAAMSIWTCMGLFVSEAPGWEAWSLILVGIAIPACLLGVAALIADRSKATFTAGALEAVAIAGGVIAASLFVREAMSDSAPLLRPITFVEAGMHVAIWLTAALLLGARVDRGATEVRRSAIGLLGGGAFIITLANAVLWLTPFWSERGEPVLFSRDSLGFVLPGVLYWMHWVLWRGRGVDQAARLAFGAGAFSVAALITLEVFEARAEAWTRGADWLSLSVAALLFALALGLNFAPGVVRPGAPRQLDLEEYLERDGRRHQRRQAG